ncbi:MAG: methyl-accepting chemotaxis protein [Bacteroidetes bacterium]|nr:methyl-accepting chemotaxis protein [Bacteroidota bacterium]
MEHFKDMNIKKKLMVTFLGMALISAIIGWIGYDAASFMMQQQDTLYLDRLVPIRDLGFVSSSIHHAESKLHQLVASKDPVEKRNLVSEITQDLQHADKLIDEYSKTYLVEEEVKGLARFRTEWPKFFQVTTDIRAYVSQSRNADALRLADGPLRSNRDAVVGILEELINVNARVAEQIDTETDQASRMAVVKLLVALGLGLLISIALGTMLSRMFSNIVNELLNASNKIALGEIDQRIEYTSKDEFGKLAESFRGMIAYMHGIAVAAESIGRGNLNVQVNAKSTNDILSNSFIRTIDVLKGMSKEINSLNNAGRNGTLTVRGNASQFQGDFKEMVQGINETLDAIVTPLNESNDVLYKMAHGDLSVRIHNDYKGDLQKMKQSVNTVGESLSNALQNVAVSIQATATASSQISASVEEMTSGLNEQSSQTSEVASAVEEMAKTIMENSKNAVDTSETALKAKQYAQEGFDVVEETAEGMTRLAAIVRKSAETVHELGRSSNQIGEIVRVIEDIADQTNLLALNAAIEAARAGDQGRGFAVVADEVRKLSERTTKSTKEIAVMIKKIQSETSGAVESMEEGTRSVDVSIEQTEKARKSLNHILDISQKVTEMVSHIATASTEQTRASDVISKNIDAISAVAQQSSIGNQQIAKAMNDLNQQTDQLQNLIGTFKFSGEVSKPQPRSVRTEKRSRSVHQENGAVEYHY